MKKSFQACYLIFLLSIFSERSAWAIIGGNEINTNSPIAQHIVLFTLKSSANHSGCTATLLDDSHALTAAHCNIGLDLSEAILIFDVKYSLGSTVRPVTDIKVHSEFPLTEPDIAIITFNGGIPEGYSPVTLGINSKLSKGDDLIIAGYGANNIDGVSGRGILRMVTAKISALNPKKKVYTAGEEGKTICHGDSGGPDFILNNGIYQQVGIHSTGDCTANAQSTDVRYFLNWLISNGVKPQKSAH